MRRAAMPVALSILVTGGFLGPSLAYDDGFGNAPGGAPQRPALLNGYVIRPAWHVAGVDYAVGPHGTPAKDPLTIALSGVDVDTSRKVVYVNGDNIRLDGYDFSLHGGYSVGIGTYGTGLNDTIINCTIVVSGFAITTASTASNTYVGYNTIDGEGATDCTMGELIYSSGQGITVEYNWIKNAPQHFVSVLSGGNVTYRYNLLDQGAFCPGAHLNYLQFGGGTSSLVDVEFNTTYQTPQASGGEGFQFYDNGSGMVDSSILAYNTMIATGGTGGNKVMSYLIHGGGTAGDGHDNYFDVTSAWGALYGGSFTGWTLCGNYDMVTGHLLDGESACPPMQVTHEPGRVSAKQATVMYDPSTGDVSFPVQHGLAAEIAIMDAAGRIVAKLTSNTWDGTDTQGARVKAGVYLYRIAGCGEAQQGKILRQK